LFSATSAAFSAAFFASKALSFHCFADSIAANLAALVFFRSSTSFAYLSLAFAISSFN
jgi:hypothetical protein